MIKVLITDDQIILAEGIKAMLSTCQDLQIVGIALDGVEAVNFVKNNQVDVVLLDIRMPNMNGVVATKEIKKISPNTKVIILTTFDDSDYILNAINYGASGYLLKDVNTATLIDAIKNAHAGDTILPGKIAQKIAMAAKNVSVNREVILKKEFNLSDREVDIAMMIYENFTNRQITSAIGISEGTTRNYISSIYIKLGVDNRQQAIEKMQSILKEN